MLLRCEDSLKPKQDRKAGFVLLLLSGMLLQALNRSEKSSGSSEKGFAGGSSLRVPTVANQKLDNTRARNGERFSQLIDKSERTGCNYVSRDLVDTGNHFER